MFAFKASPPCDRCELGLLFARYFTVVVHPTLNPLHKMVTDFVTYRTPFVRTPFSYGLYNTLPFSIMYS